MTDAHDLYGLPLERFISERTALAKELRRSGERERAETVAALRKPSAAAWAVNQLVRTQSRDITALFKAGDQAQRAQAALLSGRANGSALREALERERTAVDELTQAARGLLSSEGHGLSPSMLKRVSETLHAAALEAEARAQVRDGCLQRELRHVGLGGSGLPGQPSLPPRKAKERNRAAESASTLRKRTAGVRRASERAKRELTAAQDKRDWAVETLKQAEAALADVERRASEAEAALRQAERELSSG